jgi:hypothetical protein
MVSSGWSTTPRLVDPGERDEGVALARDAQRLAAAEGVVKRQDPGAPRAEAIDRRIGRDRAVVVRAGRLEFGAVQAAHARLRISARW